MAFLRGYFDESGKHEKHKAVSFAGLVCEDWHPFLNEWAYLQRRYKISNLHISKDKLKATAKQIKMYRHFIQVINRTVDKGFAVVVDVAGFSAIHKSVRSQLGDDAHYMAFSTVTLDLVRYAQPNLNPTVAMTCDDDENKACDIYLLYKRYQQRNINSRKTLKSIAFADSSYYPQLQAADLFCWVLRAEAMHRFFAEEFSLRELYSEFNIQSADKRIDYVTGFWSKEHLEEFATGAARGLAKIRR